MRDRRGERRALYEAILSDARATHSDRLRADEQLRELEQHEHRTTMVENLSPAEALAELESLGSALPGMIAVARGVAAVEPPEDPDDVRETLDLLLEINEKLEALLSERERALQRLNVHRRLPPAPEPIRV